MTEKIGEKHLPKSIFLLWHSDVALHNSLSLSLTQSLTHSLTLILAISPSPSRAFFYSLAINEVDKVEGQFLYPSLDFSIIRSSPTWPPEDYFIKGNLVISLITRIPTIRSPFTRSMLATVTIVG